MKILLEISDPKSLDKNSIISYQIPESLNTAIELSKKNNPDLIIAKWNMNNLKKIPRLQNQN